MQAVFISLRQTHMITSVTLVNILAFNERYNHVRRPAVEIIVCSAVKVCRDDR